MMRTMAFVAAMAVAMPAFGQSVVDHYHSLVRQIRDPYAYTLTQAGAGWRAKAEERTSIVGVVVDIGNGFIQVNDEGTGGGNLVTEAALFKPNSGGPIIALSQRFYRVTDAWGGMAQVFRSVNGRWQPLSAADLPPLMPPLFVAARANPAVPHDGNTRPVVVYLPRVGTTLNVYLTPSAQGEDCPMQNWLGTDDPVKGCKELATAPTHVELAFDKQRGAFTVTSRDGKAAPKLQ
ncbi:MAG: hypothetical protein JO055_00860 [Alphaproteobacteria bacterium]|nr:hypothetical protein [Alphaproteobacteria bacterium]